MRVAFRYISALAGEGEEEVCLERVVERGWPADVHIIGKVGITFSFFFNKTKRNAHAV